VPWTIQEFTGCTLGKRNLILAGTGKSAYILQNAKSGVSVRIYCKYWETFDTDGSFGKRRKHASSPDATPEEQQLFQRELNSKIKESCGHRRTLFTIGSYTPAPPKVGKYKAEPCGGCGEHTGVERLAASWETLRDLSHHGGRGAEHSSRFALLTT
jgi:formylmethanofuran dehydrogenase subunit E